MLKRRGNPADSVLSEFDAEFLERPVVFGLLGETNIPEGQQQHLDRVAEIMRQYPDIHLSMVGHFCNSESETESPKTAAARVRAVVQYLHGKGVSRRSWRVVMSGESDAVLDPAANYRNRRVEIGIK